MNGQNEVATLLSLISEEFAVEPVKMALPPNLCPLIKSRYGIIMHGTRLFFPNSDAVIAETNRDDKNVGVYFLNGHW